MEVARKILTLTGQLPKDLRDCVSLGGDLSRIEKWASDIDSKPVTIFENIVKNWDALNHDMSALGQDFKAAKFGPAGADTASILVDILGPVPAPPKPAAPRFDNPYGGYAMALGVNPNVAFGTPDTQSDNALHAYYGNFPY